MIKYLVKYIKSVKNFIKPDPKEEQSYDHLKWFRYSEKSNKRLFDLCGYEEYIAGTLVNIIKISYYNNEIVYQSNRLPNTIFIPIPYDKLINNLKKDKTK